MTSGTPGTSFVDQLAYFVVKVFNSLPDGFELKIIAEGKVGL